MKLSTFVATAVASTFVVGTFAIPAIAGASFPGDGVVPEPSAILVWAGIAGAGGVAYWWHKRRQS